MSGTVIRVVTIAREYGSGGAAVGRALAARLGWRLLDRGLLDQVARQARCEPEVAAGLDEQLDPWLLRLSRSLWRGGFEGVASVTDADVLDADRVADLTRRAIEQAADLGDCVVVGRGAQCVLRGRPDAFHVFVYGPRAERLRRLRERRGAAVDEAALDATDRERAAYVKRHFGATWDDRGLYDLMVSSGRGVEAAAAAVVAELAALGGRP